MANCIMHNYVSFLLLFAASFKLALSTFDFSGSGDAEITSEKKCTPVQNPSTFNSSVYRTVQDPEILARCTCACADYYVSNSLAFDHNDPKCTTGIESCIKGCINGKVNITSCDDYCCGENDCETNGEINNLCSNINKESACLAGCVEVTGVMLDEADETEVLNIFNLQFTLSQLSPLLYINQVMLHEHNLTTVAVIKVFDVHTSSSFYFVKYIDTSSVINVEPFSCKDVVVSYAYANRHGISDYSLGEMLTVAGVTPIEPLGIDNTNVNFTYDSRDGFFGHYVIHLFWMNPLDVEVIASFDIVLESALASVCQSQNFTDIIPDTGDITHYDLIAKQASDPPISKCIYLLQIISVPKYSEQLESVISYQKYVTVPTYTLPETKIICKRFLNETGNFDVLIQILLDDYIAKEELVDFIEIIPKLIERDDSNKIIDQDSYPIKTKHFKYSGTEVSKILEYLAYDYRPKSSSNFMYEFNVHIYWRNEFLYVPTVHQDVCSISALALKPETIKNITLVMPAVWETTSISLSVKWETPQMNGQFVKYQICLLDEILSMNEEPNSLFCKEVFQANQTFFSANNWFVLGVDTHCLYLQMRAENNFVQGNWSLPLVIPLDNICTGISVQSTATIPIHSSRSMQQNPVSVTFPMINTSPKISTNHDTDQSSKDANSNTLRPVTIGATVGIGFLLLTITVLFIIICLHWHLRRRKRMLEFVHENALEGIFHTGPRIQLGFTNMSFDEWEIPSSQIVMDSVLGQGAFGEVFKGVLVEPFPNSRIRTILKQSSDQYVAIKLLKTSATGTEKTDFLKEIDLMKKISESGSRHVVNMIGCVTAQEPLCLVTEFIKHGDLLTYLRLNRKKHFDSMGDPYPELQELTSIDLVSFGYQIAAGMEFLGSMGIVHRDLACRNILVGEGKSLKISDFGMSRLIGDGDNDAYVKTTKGRLPLKWMAIESICDRQFTVASDVWSYGITLWEIATLGGFPYPTIENEKLLQKLKCGYRMECPENCSKEIYQVMIECWSENPKTRPKFSTLRKLFDNILSAQHADVYIDLQTDENSLIYSSNDEANISSCSCTLSAKQFPKSPSPRACTKGKSIDMEFLQVTNPWERNPNNIARSLSHLSIPGSETPPTRPMSMSMWDANSRKENMYVDVPAGGSQNLDQCKNFKN